MTLVDYWENRYASGGTSGAGSRGENAARKATFVNDLIRRRDVRSVIDWGCGDGEQAALLHAVDYLGIDVSTSAITRCIDRMPDRQWLRMDPRSTVRMALRAELALSMDVLFHLVDDADFHGYLSRLFASAWRFVVIHSTNVDTEPNGHMRHRHFTDAVFPHAPGWQLASQADDPHEPGFYLYERRT